MDWLALAIAALIGATLAGVTGFGGAAILLPVLVQIYGVKAAIPILTVAQLIGNASRVYLHRVEVNWKIVGYFAITGIPSAYIGGQFFAKASAPLLLRLLGFFLLAVVVWRWMGGRRVRSFSTMGFSAIGAVFSFLSALVGSVGPFIVPFFLAAGLTKGAFIGTEALCTVVMHVFKIAAYQQTSVISFQHVGVGLALGPLMIFGSWAGKQIMHRISERAFTILVELTLIVAGLKMLFSG